MGAPEPSIEPARQLAECGVMGGLPPLPCWSEPITGRSTGVEGPRYPSWWRNTP